jgi:hypothetical protein
VLSAKYITHAALAYKRLEPVGTAYYIAGFELATAATLVAQSDSVVLIKLLLVNWSFFRRSAIANNCSIKI